MDSGLIFILSGPAGAGKTTLTRMLCEAEKRCILSISATTRPPRGKEKDGVDYFFLSREEFTARVAKGEFAEHAEFSNNFYGTPKWFLDEQTSKGRHVVLDIEVKGAAQLRGHYPNAVRIFILPPSPEMLIQRLKRRGTESPEEIARRLRVAREEVARLEEYDYLLVNDDMQRAFEHLRGILHAQEQIIRGGERDRWLGGRSLEEALQ